MSLPRLNSVNRLTAAVLLAGVFSIGGVAQDSAPTASIRHPKPLNQLRRRDLW